jgi:hypothetical protein
MGWGRCVRSGRRSELDCAHFNWRFLPLLREFVRFSGMDERCLRFHAKLLSGTCPWCGGAIVNGAVTGAIVFFDETAIDFAATESEFAFLGNGRRSLYEVVTDNGRLDCQIASKLILSVAKQLEQIHNVARFHGCVCPGSIFVDDQGGAILGMVGGPRIGQVADTSIILHEVDGRSVVADYLAPEQVLNSSEPDPRIDIYSLGCTLYFLLVGTPPFGDGSISETLLKHQTAIPTPIDQLRPDVPKELAQICAKMLAKKPADRYQTAAEVAAALSRVE